MTIHKDKEACVLSISCIELICFSICFPAAPKLPTNTSKVFLPQARLPLANLLPTLLLYLPLEANINSMHRSSKMAGTEPPNSDPYPPPTTIAQTTDLLRKMQSSVNDSIHSVKNTMQAKLQLNWYFVKPGVFKIDFLCLQDRATALQQTVQAREGSTMDLREQNEYTAFERGCQGVVSNGQSDHAVTGLFPRQTWRLNAPPRHREYLHRTLGDQGPNGHGRQMKK